MFFSSIHELNVDSGGWVSQWCCILDTTTWKYKLGEIYFPSLLPEESSDRVESDDRCALILVFFLFLWGSRDFKCCMFRTNEHNACCLKIYDREEIWRRTEEFAQSICNKLYKNYNQVSGFTPARILIEATTQFCMSRVQNFRISFYFIRDWS